MTEKLSNTEQRKRGGVIDQRQQRIDPTGTEGELAANPGPRRSQKQPGQDPRDPQDGDGNAK